MKLLADWVGRTVKVTLRLPTPVTLLGVLLAVDEASILLELPAGHTVIPIGSILHVSLPE